MYTAPCIALGARSFHPSRVAHRRHIALSKGAAPVSLASHSCEERLAELETENALLREHVKVLVGRVRYLEARPAKDSHNSSRPPSSDW